MEQSKTVSSGESAGAMRKSVFDSSSEEDEVGEELTPFHISWLPLSIVGNSQFLGICALPGCKYKEVRRNLQRDIEELKTQGVQDVFVFCTRHELKRYRVPLLLELYQQRGFTVHHMPFADSNVPELGQCCSILERLQHNLENNHRTVLQSYGGLGRSAFIAACLLLQLSPTMTADKAIELLRELRGKGAIKTIKQYNFLHEFRDKFGSYKETRDVPAEAYASQ